MCVPAMSFLLAARARTSSGRKARVTGAASANAFNTRASADRVWSSPILARSRAPRATPQAGKAGQDRRIGVGGECAVDPCLELGEQGAHGVKLAEQAAQLQTHGLLDLLGLVHVLGLQEFAQPSRLYSSLATSLAQQRGEATLGQRCRLMRRRSGSQDRAIGR
jgi:hypothetical protein